MNHASGMLASSRKLKERHRRSKDIKSKQPAMPSKEQKSTFLPSLAEGSENMVELCTFKDILDNIVSTIRRSAAVQPTDPISRHS